MCIGSAATYFAFLHIDKILPMLRLGLSIPVHHCCHKAKLPLILLLIYLQSRFMLTFSSIYFTSFFIQLIQLLIATLIACFIIQMFKFEIVTIFRSFFQILVTSIKLDFPRSISKYISTDSSSSHL